MQRRSPVRWLLAVLIRVFFRRIAIVGRELVPPGGGVLFVLNHPNSLVDPAFLLAFAPRRVVFLAKEPLFRTPVVRWFVRASGAIPVHRRQDAGDMVKNRETFTRVWEELARGGAVALFPEGTSHSDPALRPLKTGAARLAIGASATGGGGVRIVPAGLYYDAKTRFRSTAVLCFGSPIEVVPGTLGAQGEPDAAGVHALTARIEDALSGVTIHADREEALHLAALAERAYSVTGGAPPALAARFDLRQRLLQGYAELRRIAPRRIGHLELELERYDAELKSAGLAPEQAAAHAVPATTAAGRTARALALLILTAPFAALGIVVHLPAYLVIGPFVTRALGVERDVTATAKMLAAGLLYPLTWAAVMALAWRWRGPGVALIALTLLPLSGYAALRFVERSDRLIGATRGVLLRLFRRRASLRLEARRRRIVAAIDELATLLPGG